ncbi:Anti-sigma regulatory factor [Burkholderia sp. 8Y]|nr:Anti-sigma regulatory factor [Burkholderia sp. 8Y]
MAAQQRHEIAEATQIASARRSIGELARGLGFNETIAGELAIVVTECGTNLLKHAGSGELLVRPLMDAGERYGIEILCVDSGPGIHDLYRCFEDGYTTAGSPGNGMGAIRRLSGELDIWSMPQQGTVMRVVCWNRAAAPVAADPAAPARVTYGVVNLPLRTETVSGDAWSCSAGDNGFTVLVADGLGHGPLANVAAVEAARVLGSHGDAPLERIMEIANEALRPTRGAAVGIARMPTLASTASASGAKVAFTGIGNIAASVWTESSHRHLVSHSGIVGHGARRVQQFDVPYPPSALVVLHSDGIGSRWDLARYPGLSARHPALVAAVLYRDFSRGRDDVTVFVARAAGGA